MSDEQRVRSLLTAAAEVPDLAAAPVERLIAAGRRRRRLNQIAAAAAAAVAVVAAVTIPALFRGAAVPGPAAPRIASPAVTAAELSHGHWSRLQQSPIREVGDFIAAWTGREILLVNVNRLEGAAYVPGVGWHRIAAIPDGLGTDMQDAFWTGSDLVVLHRGPAAAHGAAAPVAAIYTPASNTWSVVGFPLPAQSGCEPQSCAVASLGDRIVFAEVVSGRLMAYDYSLSTRSWQRLHVSLPASHRVSQLSMIAADGRLILWSSWNSGPGFSLGKAGTWGVDVRTMNADGVWRAVAGWPQNLVYFTPQSAANGQILLVSAGGESHLPAAYLVDAATLKLRPVTAAPLIPGATQIWTGAAVVAVGAASSFPYPHAPNYAVTVLDPSTGRWSRPVTGPPGQSPALLDFPVSVIWAGTQLVVTDGQFVYAFGR